MLICYKIQSTIISWSKITFLFNNLKLEYHFGNCQLVMRQNVTCWPSTEPSIKRCTWVNKRKNSETGASGRRYRNITLTCGRGWIRWWWQMCTPTGSRWAWDNYITRYHRRLGSVAVADRMPASDWGLGPSVTHSWAAHPECGRSAAMVRRTLGQYVAVCPRLQIASHTQPTSTLLRIKCERDIFIKKSVRLFIVVRHYCWLCSAYIYICIMYIQQKTDNLFESFNNEQGGYILQHRRATTKGDYR